MTIRVFPWFACLVLLLASPPLRAQQEDAKKVARKLLADGDAYLQRGDALAKRGKKEKANEQFLLALENYQRAFETVPQPQIYFAIGEAEIKLGRYFDAYKHYTTLLEESEKISDELRAAVEVRIDRAKDNLAVVTIIAKPVGATVSLDGESVGRAPLGKPLVIAPGEHQLAVRFRGHSPFEESLTLSRGDKTTKTIALEPLPDVVHSTSHPTPPPRTIYERPKAPGRGILISGLVTTSVLTAVATVTGIVAVSKHGTLTDAALPIEDRKAAGDSGRTLAIVTDVMLVGALAAGGFTTYYYYKVYRPRQRALELTAESQQAVWMSPYVDNQGAGLAVGGSF